MEHNKSKKQNVIAYNNFWIDCYTTMLNAILVTPDKSNEHLIYNNNYTYDIMKVEREKGSLFQPYIKMNHEKVEKYILLNKQCIEPKSDDEIVDVIMTAIEQDKICMARFDLFYLIKDNIHWQKNHITHLSLVYGYDYEHREFNILETGNQGYQEYTVPFETVVESVKSAGNRIVTYDRELNTEMLIYCEDDVISQGKTIVESIDTIFKDEDLIFNFDGLDEQMMNYFLDICHGLLLGIRYRQKVNRLLFDFLHYEQGTAFAALEDEYEILKSKIIKYRMRNRFESHIAECKDIFIGLMKKEKGIWLDII